MDCDVLVVGLGPVGLTLTALLRDQGVEAICLDREVKPPGLPRAVVLDDAALRVLQAVGVTPRGLVQERVILRLANGRAITLLRTPERTSLGQPALMSLHQPQLEEQLEAKAGELRRGWELIDLTQDANWVRARTRDHTGTERAIQARWLVGCDGAHSTVRQAAGLAWRGSTFAQPWTVIDGHPRSPVAASDHVEFIGDPRGPAVTLPLGDGLRRWELLGDRLSDMPGLLTRWCQEVEVIRAAVYTYHARRAESWRAGRVLLAGDAAHAMPPFAGQGLGAGLLDVANLAWRLGGVIAGADPWLLNGYEAERAPHVRAMTRYARLIGALVQVRRPRLAAARDAALIALEATPRLGAWLQTGALKPQPTPEWLPQPMVRDAHGESRPLDELLGTDRVLITCAARTEPGSRALVLGADLQAPDLERWLARRHAAAVVVRPDHAVDALLPG